MRAHRERRFAETYASCYGRVHAYAARRVGSHAADDIAAEAFMVAWRRVDELPAEPLPWLYGVARNIVARHRASMARQDAVRTALEREPPAALPGEATDDHLWRAWQRLSAADQEVLALVAWEDLPVREAAEVLGCPARVFSVRLHRARRRLERLLDDPASTPIPTLSEVS